jgi:hypothetical protein
MPMKRALGLSLLPLLLSAQETPRPNRVAWEAIFPEPLPDGVSALSLEATSQFLRPDRRASIDGRTVARLDGEEWQLTGDLALRLGPGRLHARIRIVDRSGGFADQAFYSYHQALSLPQGGRNLAPKYTFDYHLERDGVVIADLHRSGVSLMDTDLAYLVEKGNRREGGRIGVSVQLPTGKREDFSGSGGTDALLGVAAWKTFDPIRVFGQVEQVWITLPKASPYRAVLATHAMQRAWVGAAYQGEGPGILGGLGLEISLAYLQNPYRVGISRLDVAGWQQHWTITHKALPRWRFGISEEAGTFHSPDITAFVTYRFKS